MILSIYCTYWPATDKLQVETQKEHLQTCVPRTGYAIVASSKVEAWHARYLFISISYETTARMPSLDLGR